jgi:hypothetical protein
MSATNDSCPECGALLERGRTCRDSFHELLALEYDVPGGPGALAHFFAVASYNLQHPSGFVPLVLRGLESSLSDALNGRAEILELRRRASSATDGARRVLRRASDVREVPTHWPRSWPLTVRDVCAVDPAEYVDRVRQWASSVERTLRTSSTHS